MTAEDVMELVIRYCAQHAQRDPYAYQLPGRGPVYTISPDGLLDFLEERVPFDKEKAEQWEREAKAEKAKGV